MTNHYESWWQKNLGAEKYLHNGEWYNAPSIQTFEQWMGDHNAADRVRARNILLQYNKLLDAGCGAAPEYQAVLSDKYTGLDITPKLVEYNKSRGINCVHGSLNSIPFEDNAFDVSMSRHVVEHMKDITEPLNELIRVSKKQVLILFFIKPHDGNEHIRSLDNEDTEWEVYHNTYSRPLIENQLNSNPKVAEYEWLDGCASTQSYLNILLK